ncbi:MAG: Rid family detoxifying hydrolase [Burkholderiales bacterium]|nr:Rid family detoxifying hydrolase [Burkholderiales bacterium]
MAKQAIHTSAAPAAIGTYSQGIRAGQTIYLSGQLGLDPATGNLREGIDAQIDQAFQNLRAVAQAGGATLDDAVKLTLYLTDLGNFAKVNETMARYFTQPFPARATVQVSALPKGAGFEVEAVVVFP